jgi:hypothetical protein
MSNAALFLVVVFTAAAVYFAARVLVPAFGRYRGKRLVTCPETHEPAAVAVDAVHAAVTAGIGEPVLQLKTCTRWPERESCGQECLSQIAASPEGCLVRNVATRWYQGKTCAFCAKPFGGIGWLERQPALLSPEGKSVPWTEVRAELLPGILETHRPVCWDCHIVETMRNRHPEMVVERPAH